MNLLFAQTIPREGQTLVPVRPLEGESKGGVSTSLLQTTRGKNPPRPYHHPPHRPKRSDQEIMGRPTPELRPGGGDVELRTSENSSTPYRPLRASEQVVGWLSFEEAINRAKAEKRKVFIHLYTTWCGWCKRMEETTFSDPLVVRYLNEKFYPVKFDAEFTEEITFKSKTYTMRRESSRRGYHELALELLNGRLGFPTMVFLDENLDVIQAISGYRDPDNLFVILNYFGTDSHKTIPWETYEQRFTRQR
ncbi:MAG: DUF255 domain-containing protein [Saprospiraceae bacterium]|nr:DUF255 domain-containing protein [Saprospiraceae bacterium]MDW8484182.1 DUF255 domain-containing protein [Saprospiraceae bacterium]